MSDEKLTVDTEQASTQYDIEATVTSLLNDLGAEWEITTISEGQEVGAVDRRICQPRRALILWLDGEVKPCE